MFKKILIGLGVLVVVFVAVVALQPSEFRITRSATIAAPPEAVFARVNDLPSWEAWSPWARLDPSATTTFEGPKSGTGAVFTWSGNDQIGEGRMTITESRPSELVRFRLEFLKPCTGTNTAEFTFAPEGDQTVVTWTMTGTNSFMAKAFCMFVDMDRMVGADFEKGLAQMKSVVEAESRK